MLMCVIVLVGLCGMLLLIMVSGLGHCLEHLKSKMPYFLFFFVLFLFFLFFLRRILDVFEALFAMQEYIGCEQRQHQERQDHQEHGEDDQREAAEKELAALLDQLLVDRSFGGRFAYKDGWRGLTKSRDLKL